jgi:hypothetical protein
MRPIAAQGFSDCFGNTFELVSAVVGHCSGATFGSKFAAALADGQDLLGDRDALTRTVLFSTHGAIGFYPETTFRSLTVGAPCE